MNLPSGFLLQKGKYKLMNVIGQGGFGITYRGIWYTEVKGSLGTIKTEVPVCIKEYFFKDYCFREEKTFKVKVYSETGKALFEKFKEKLTKEARILSEVHHPYIVNVLEVFEENNTAYIAMEYIPGHSLKYILEQRRYLPENIALKYIHQIGEALQFVHEKNILHLDVKPSNILIDQKDNARLIDFGVSKRYDMEQEETSTTLLTLSKGFASIEQYDSEGIQTFTPYPDIYSLGATLYNLLTGQIPTESILRATRPLKSPREINPAISEKTEQVILKAMCIVPTDRYASVREMMAALDYPKETTDHIDDKSTQNLPENENVEETTLLRDKNDIPQDDRNMTEDEDETTLLNVKPAQAEKPDDTRKKHKGTHKSVYLWASVILLGACLFWILNPMGKRQEKDPQEESSSGGNMAFQSDNKGDTDSISLGVDTLKRDVVNTTALIDSTQDSSFTEKEKQPLLSENEEKASGSPVAEEKKSPLPEKEEVDTKARYSELIASAKSKMEQRKYSQARKDLEAARDLNLTEEVVRMIISCDELFKQEQIKQKRGQYEEKMPFGNYMIVRKKSNGRYGAIDQEAVERIPCVYLSVGRAENGRAFEREDHLFDIYDSSAQIINRGVTYY